MQLSTAKDRFLQFFRPAKAADAADASSDSAKSWPAPGRKSNGLVLQRSAVGASSLLSRSESLSTGASAPPFPVPVQEDAFAMPRPVSIPGASSPWAPSERKMDALAFRRAAPVSAEVEFSRPPYFEKKSARHPGGLCRSC